MGASVRNSLADFTLGLTEFRVKSRREVVAMMQTTKARHRDNVRRKRRLFCRRSTTGSLLRQTEMRSVVVVIVEVFGHEAFQVPLIEHNDMIEQFAAATADETFRNTILPRAFEGGAHRLQPDGPDGFPHLGAEDCVAVVDQVFLSCIVRKCFAQLLRNPLAAGMPRDVEVQHTPPVMGNDEETVKNAECERGYSEEIHRGDGLAMIAEKRRPSFGRLRISWRFPHPAEHSSLGNFEAQHLQLTMDARRSPGRVLSNHAED